MLRGSREPSESRTFIALSVFTKRRKSTNQISRPGNFNSPMESSSFCACPVTVVCVSGGTPSLVALAKLWETLTRRLSHTRRTVLFSDFLTVIIPQSTHRLFWVLHGANCEWGVVTRELPTKLKCERIRWAGVNRSSSRRLVYLVVPTFPQFVKATCGAFSSSLSLLFWQTRGPSFQRHSPGSCNSIDTRAPRAVASRILDDSRLR